MPDEFQNFEDLSRSMSVGIDFRIVCQDKGPGNPLIIAPHGGRIESVTSDIAKIAAGEDFGFYLFEGLRSSGNGRLHITSSHFDEPTALRMAARASVIVAIHGRQDMDDAETVYMGGLDHSLAEAISERLNSAGFRSRTDDHPFPGKNRFNICNRGGTRAGAQLEIPHTLRRHLGESGNRNLLTDFTRAIRAGIGACI
jgi:phage replication-related protein YjqB (UPF0714/DUF867 family)